jgi:hypothetical protein
MLTDLITDLQNNGIWECVGPDDYKKVEHYVVTITNIFGAMKKLPGLLTM